jgi:hypothetical protein
MEKFKKSIKVLKKAKLNSAYKSIVTTAELAWSSNTRAKKLIDLKNDEIEGEFELLILQDSLNQWITQMEDLRNAAEKITKRFSDTLYERRYNEEVEGDS